MLNYFPANEIDFDYSRNHTKQLLYNLTWFGSLTNCYFFDRRASGNEMINNLHTSYYSIHVCELIMRITHQQKEIANSDFLIVMNISDYKLEVCWRKFGMSQC